MASPCKRLLIDRAMEWCNFERGARIADVGCGDGEVVRYLRERHRLDAHGLDKHAEGAFVMRGDAHALPFGDEELDGVLFQCSLSIMTDPFRALCEAWRVLKFDGWLILCDLFAWEIPKNFLGVSSVLGRIDELETIIDRLREAGFHYKLFADHTLSMQHEWAQRIWDDDRDTLDAEITRLWMTLREASCGYGLFIAKKEWGNDEFVAC